MTIPTMRASDSGQDGHCNGVGAGHLNNQGDLDFVLGFADSIMLKAALTAISDMPPQGNLAAV